MFYIDLQYPVNFEQTMLTDTYMYVPDSGFSRNITCINLMGA